MNENQNGLSGMGMGKSITIGVIVLIVLLIFSAFGTYNSLVSTRENVDAQWSNINTQLQRRLDLIPRLVETVKGYTSHEAGIMTEVANARAKLAGANTVEEKSAANAELSGALSRLLAISENYPDLKADKEFTALMDELAGTENRISTARQDYNEAVKTYNTKIKRFPAVLFANIFGFNEADYFEAQEGAETAPTVNFGN